MCTSRKGASTKSRTDVVNFPRKPVNPQHRDIACSLRPCDTTCACIRGIYGTVRNIRTRTHVKRVSVSCKLLRVKFHVIWYHDVTGSGLHQERCTCMIPYPVVLTTSKSQPNTYSVLYSGYRQPCMYFTITRVYYVVKFMALSYNVCRVLFV